MEIEGGEEDEYYEEEEGDGPDQWREEWEGKLQDGGLHGGLDDMTSC